MTNQGRRKRRTHPLTILIILVLLFLIPFSIAWLMFNGHHIFGRLLNHGELVKPPFSVSLLHLRNERGELLNNRLTNRKKKAPARLRTNGKWTLLYFNPGLCENACRKGMYNLRQIRIAMGKNRERVQRALLTYPSNEANNIAINLIISENYAGTRHLTIKEKNYTDVVREHIHKVYALRSGTIYLINPLGNVVMTYEPGANPKGIFKDLKKLLKVSQIG